jgi:thioredoxin 1
MAENVLEITDDNFEDTVLNSDTPIVVDFWAEWCGPCKMIAPTLEQLADEYVGTFKVGKLNVDDNRETAMKYGDNFEDTVLNSETPIVVDFWAEWCPPCKIIAPSLEQLADEYVGTFKVGKLNVDDNRETAMKYGIRGIPTLLVIKEGDVTEQIVGAHPKDTLKDKILSAL